MKRARIGPNYVANLDSLGPIRRSDAMADVVEGFGEQIAGRARVIAPVDTGAFRDGIRVIVERHPNEVVAHIGSSDRKAILVETRTHVMRRALG